MREQLDDALLATMDRMAREIGSIIGSVCREKGGFGFALLIFAFQGPEATWISNADRADMVKMLREFIERLEAGTADELARPKGSG